MPLRRGGATDCPRAGAVEGARRTCLHQRVYDLVDHPTTGSLPVPGRTSTGERRLLVCGRQASASEPTPRRLQAHPPRKPVGPRGAGPRETLGDESRGAGPLRRPRQGAQAPGPPYPQRARASSPLAPAVHASISRITALTMGSRSVRVRQVGGPLWSPTRPRLPPNYGGAAAGRTRQRWTWPQGTRAALLVLRR